MVTRELGSLNSFSIFWLFENLSFGDYPIFCWGYIGDPGFWGYITANPLVFPTGLRRSNGTGRKWPVFWAFLLLGNRRKQQTQREKDKAFDIFWFPCGSTFTSHIRAC